MSTPTSQFFDISQSLRYTADDLYSLAAAFRRTGQTAAADELVQHADNILDQSLNVTEVWSQHISASLAETERETGQVLLLALRHAVEKSK